MFGERTMRVARFGELTVHTNLEGFAIVAATGFAGDSLLEAALIIASFGLGTALHLACHLAVAIAFGKGIDRMVLTRAGRIDYSGAPPTFVENIVRTAAGPAMNALCALGGYLVLRAVDTSAWPVLDLALRTFTWCSLALTCINFLPAVPLDGGLILRSFMQRFIGEDRARRVALQLSLVLMTAVFVIGVWKVQPVLLYIAVVISYDNWRTLSSERAVRVDASRALGVQSGG